MPIPLLTWRQTLGKSGVSQQTSQTISLVNQSSESASGQILHHILCFLRNMVRDWRFHLLLLFSSMKMIKKCIWYLERYLESRAYVGL